MTALKTSSRTSLPPPGTQGVWVPQTFAVCLCVFVCLCMCVCSGGSKPPSAAPCSINPGNTSAGFLASSESSGGMERMQGGCGESPGSSQRPAPTVNLVPLLSGLPPASL